MQEEQWKQAGTAERGVGLVPEGDDENKEKAKQSKH
jgi:hypothetical protein